MKRVLVWLMSVVVLVGISTMSVKAADTPVKVEESFLLADVNEVTSDIMIQPRGAFLQTGDSILSKAGTNLVTVGGSTIAQKIVKSVGINVILEKIDENDMKWVRVDSWTKEEVNSTMVEFSKTVTVPRDTFYRVRSIHYAETDTSSSYTSGLFIK